MLGGINLDTKLDSVPKPLVTLNQWFIFISVLIALLTSIHVILLFPLLTGLIGLLFNKNPIMLLGKRLLNNPSESYLQEEVTQVKFNQTIAVACLTFSLIGFTFGLPVIGFIFAIMVAAAALIANFGFCIGCFIRYQWKQYQYKRTVKN